MSNHDGIERSEVRDMSDETKKELNADIITGEPGSHPVGTGVGSVGGAATGAAIGPLGSLVGGAVGAIIGGGAGRAAAEAIDPTREEAYWRAEYLNAEYYKESYSFERDFHPAYAVGYASRVQYPINAQFENHEDDLERSWHKVKGDSRLDWSEARKAARDAWHRAS